MGFGSVATPCLRLRGEFIPDGALVQLVGVLGRVAFFDRVAARVGGTGCRPDQAETTDVVAEHRFVVEVVAAEAVTVME